jgi:hypothetical protein
VGRKSTRFWIFFVVLALHAVLLIALAILSRYRIFLAAQQPLQLVPILSMSRNDQRTLPMLAPKQDTQIPVLRPDPTTSIFAPSPLDDRQENEVDWEGEARRAAQDSAGGAGPTPKRKPNPPSTAVINGLPGPKYHKGNQIPTSNGDTMIFINDRCYQIASVIPSVSTASSNGMGLQTYCMRDSKEPRGDLFKDLAAYKKLHQEK